VVLFGDEHPEAPDNRWQAEYRALLEVYAQADAECKRRSVAGHYRHEAVLLDSAFHRLERIGIVERRRIPVERLVDRALSVSSTSPARLGLRVDELAARVRELALRYADGDLVTEVVESTALIAKRS